MLEGRADEGWIKIGFEGKREFCNPAGFVQGGFLSAMLDDSIGPAVFTMTHEKIYPSTNQYDRQLPGGGEAWPYDRRS